MTSSTQMILLSALLVGTFFSIGLCIPTATPTYQDTPIMMTTSGQECSSKTEKLNCSFQMNQHPEITAMMSLILSKTESVDSDNYTEIASITMVDPDKVTVMNSLGATVTGQLVPGGKSYIQYKWDVSDSQAAGRWRCRVSAMDKLGHPVNKVQETLVNQIPDNPLSLLITTQQELNKTRYELTKIKQQCHIQPTVPQTPSSLPQDFIKATVYNNHRYLLSLYTTMNITAYWERCRQLGGYLAEFNTQDEWKNVTGFLGDLQLGEMHVYLGLTDQGHTGRWSYMTSPRPAEVLEWGPDDYTSERQNCAYLNTVNLKLYNNYCLSSGSDQFLCEVPM